MVSYLRIPKVIISQGGSRMSSQTQSESCQLCLHGLHIQRCAKARACLGSYSASRLEISLSRMTCSM